MLLGYVAGLAIVVASYQVPGTQDATERLLAHWEQRYFAPDVPESVVQWWYENGRPSLAIAEAIQERYAIYSKSHARLIEGVRSRLVQQSEGGHTKLTSIGNELQDAKHRMAKELADDVGAMLRDDDDLRELWFSAIRRNTRARVIPKAAINDSTRWSIDLVQVIDAANLPVEDRVEVVDVLYQYERSLNDALLALTTRTPLLAARMNEAIDADQRGAITRELIKLHEAIARINREYADEIQARLPGRAAGVFVERLSAARYPELFRRSPVEIAIDRLESSVIPVDVARSCREIVAAFESEASRLRAEVIAANDGWNASSAQRRRDDLVADGGTTYQALRAQHPGLDALRERRDLEEVTIRQLRACVMHVLHDLDFETRIALSVNETSDG